jgi:hypothetical protein
MLTHKKTRVVGNPAGRAFGKGYSRPKSSGKRKSGNPGSIIGFQLAGNPGRKVNRMAVTKKKSSKPQHHKPAGYHMTGHHKHNPAKRHHKRSNPSAMSGIGPLVTNAVFVIAGALGSKLGAQAVLGTNNTGVVGYAGNAAAGLVLWWGAEKLLKNRAAASGILAGTVVQIVLRLINDYTPFGSYVAQLGMGDYQVQSFTTPQVLVDPTRSAEIAIPAGWGAPAPTAVAGAAAGMGGLYSPRRGYGGGLYRVA